MHFSGGQSKNLLGLLWHLQKANQLSWLLLHVGLLPFNELVPHDSSRPWAAGAALGRGSRELACNTSGASSLGH